MSDSSLDLDALEREGRPEPLKITYRGEEFTLADPRLMSWSDYNTIDFEQVDGPIRTVLDVDDLERFMALKPSMQALEVLTNRITEHYFGTTQGESEGSSAS